MVISIVGGLQDKLVKDKVLHQMSEKIGPSLQNRWDLSDNVTNCSRYNVLWSNSINVFNEYHEKFKVKMWSEEEQAKLVPIFVRR